MASVLDELVEMSRRLGDPAKDYVILGEGNTSARADESSFWVKASGAKMGQIVASNFVRVRFEPMLEMISGGPLSDDEIKERLGTARADPGVRAWPSVETMMHIGIYQARKNIKAVIHTHSVFASAVAVAGMDIPSILDDQVTFIGGEIKLAGHALSGSEEQVDNVIAALGNRNAVLLPNHGAVGIGKTLRDAFTVCELLEKTARIYCLALTLGNANLLPAEVVEVERAYFNMLQSGG